MNSLLAYFISLFVIVVSVLNTLYIKSELERLFRERNGVFLFHICNVLIILIAAFATYAVMTRYIIGSQFNWLLQLVILLFMIIPIYILGHFAFETYKLNNRKYTSAEDGKILIISEKYLNGKKRSSRFKKYNDF